MDDDSTADCFRQIARDHATAIDLTEIAVQTLNNKGELTPECERRRLRLADELLENNTPVVIFLVKSLAGMIMLSGRDPEAVFAGLRKAAGARLDYAEQVLREQGHAT